MDLARHHWNIGQQLYVVLCSLMLCWNQRLQCYGGYMSVLMGAVLKHQIDLSFMLLGAVLYQWNVHLT